MNLEGLSRWKRYLIYRAINFGFLNAGITFAIYYDYPYFAIAGLLLTFIGSTITFTVDETLQEVNPISIKGELSLLVVMTFFLLSQSNTTGIVLFTHALFTQTVFTIILYLLIDKEAWEMNETDEMSNEQLVRESYQWLKENTDSDNVR